MNDLNAIMAQYNKHKRILTMLNLFKPMFKDKRELHALEARKWSNLYWDTTANLKRGLK